MAIEQFVSVGCSLPAGLEEDLPTLLSDVPVLGTEIHDQCDGRIDVTVYLSGADVDRAADVQRLISAVGGDDFHVETVEEEDWLADYRKTVTPFAVATTWWLDPHPDAPTPAPPNRNRLVIPPRMAFGSGSHESTRLILGALEKIELQGKTVFDLGTGSGVLALASDHSGARLVLAVDIDAVAILIARQIRDLQEWRPAVHYVIGSADCATPRLFDIVLCNMISTHSTPLLEAMGKVLAPGGTLVLSGLLEAEVAVVTGELETRGLAVSNVTTLNEWASLSASRRR